MMAHETAARRAGRAVLAMALLPLAATLGCGDSNSDRAPRAEPVLCGDGQMPGFTCRDLSDFESFFFARQSHTGFCPPPDAIFRVGVDGDGQMRGTILKRPHDEAPSCRGEFEDPDCFDLTAVERTLAPEEMARLRSAFRSVELFLGEDPTCDHSDMPCLVNSFDWHPTPLAVELPCSFLSISTRDAERLIGVLEGLMRHDPAE